MSEKRIQSGSCRTQFFTLPRHHVDGVVQQRIANFGGRLGHENARLRLPPHQHRQRADMVLMRMRNNDRVELSITEHFQIRQCFFALELRVHPAIEHQSTAAPF